MVAILITSNGKNIVSTAVPHVRTLFRSGKKFITEGTTPRIIPKYTFFSVYWIKNDCRVRELELMTNFGQVNQVSSERID